MNPYFAEKGCAFRTFWMGLQQSSPLSPRCILINRFPRSCNPVSLLSILTLPMGNKDLSILANDNGAFFFSQKLADNDEMVSITSFTYHLSNSLSESDIIASTWNWYSTTKFFSIKPPVGVLSPLCLPRAVEPFLGWMPEHVRFYLICLPGGFGEWSSEVVGSQLGESISAIAWVKSIAKMMAFFCHDERNILHIVHQLVCQPTHMGKERNCTVWFLRTSPLPTSPFWMEDLVLSFPLQFSLSFSTSSAKKAP